MSNAMMNEAANAATNVVGLTTIEAVQHTFLDQFCVDWVDTFLWIGLVMIGVGALLGVAYAVFEIFAQKVDPKLRDPQAAGGLGDVLMPFKELVSVLAKAPAWFALFIFGLAVVWLASTQIPLICRPEPPTNEKEAAKSKGAGGATSDARKAGSDASDPQAGGAG